MATTSSGRSGRPALIWALVAAIALAMAAFLFAFAREPRAMLAGGSSWAPEPVVRRVDPHGKPRPIASASNRDAPGTADSLIDDLRRAMASAAPDVRDLVLSDYLPGIIETDPARAARFAELETDSWSREQALRLVAQHWALMDLEAAMRWADSLGDTVERGQTFANIAIARATVDPPDALRVIEESRVDGLEAIAAGVAEQWASRDFDGALAWTLDRPADVRRDELLQRLIHVRAERNPADAARLAAHSFVDPQRRLEALATIAARWGQTDAASARAWAAGLDAGARRKVNEEFALLALKADRAQP